MREFAKRTVSELRASPWGNHFGLITFAASPRVNFYFNTLSENTLNNYEVNRLIGESPRLPGAPRVDLALQKASSYLFTEENGMRRHARKVCSKAKAVINKRTDARS